MNRWNTYIGYPQTKGAAADDIRQCAYTSHTRNVLDDLGTPIVALATQRTGDSCDVGRYLELANRVEDTWLVIPAISAPLLTPALGSARATYELNHVPSQHTISLFLFAGMGAVTLVSIVFIVALCRLMFMDDENSRDCSWQRPQTGQRGSTLNQTGIEKGIRLYKAVSFSLELGGLTLHVASVCTV